MKPAPDFYNTTGENGDQLRLFRKGAQHQQQLIIDFFRNTPPHRFSPSQVRDRLFFGDGTPITSVRRAITNLTTAGSLRKTSSRVLGGYGHPETVWEVVP